MNAVNDSHRSELRELIELNFARYDAKLEQRIAEVRADLKTGLAELGATLRAEMTQGAASLKSGLLKMDVRLLGDDGLGRVGHRRRDRESAPPALNTCAQPRY